MTDTRRATAIRAILDLNRKRWAETFEHFGTGQPTDIEWLVEIGRPDAERTADAIMLALDAMPNPEAKPPGLNGLYQIARDGSDSIYDLLPDWMPARTRRKLSVMAFTSGTVTNYLVRAVCAVIWAGQQRDAMPKPEKPAPWRWFTDAQWARIPLPMKERWWKETEYGAREPSPELAAELGRFAL